MSEGGGIACSAYHQTNDRCLPTVHASKTRTILRTLELPRIPPPGHRTSTVSGARGSTQYTSTSFLCLRTGRKHAASKRTLKPPARGLRNRGSLWRTPP